MKEKKNFKALEFEELLERQRKKDEAELKSAKLQAIREVKSWKKVNIFAAEPEKKMSLADKLKRIFGK
jgi:hypothetical protein